MIINVPSLGSLRRSASRRFGNLPLRQKYLFSHVIVVLLTVFVISSASYYITRNQVERRAGEFSSTILQKASFIWDTKVEEIVDYFIVQFDAFNLGSYLKPSNSVNEYLTRLRVEKFLSDIITYKAGIRFIEIQSTQGLLYFNRRDGEAYGKDWVRSLIDNSYVHSLRAKPVFQTLSDGTIMMTKVLYDLKTTEYLGVLAVGFDADTFSVVFPDGNKEALGYLLVVDDKLGRAVVSSPGAAGLVPYYRADGGRTQKIQGLSYLVDEVRSGDGRWLFLSYTPIPALARLSVYAGLYIIIASALVLAAAVALSMLLSKRESERILRIMDYAGQIASGNLSGHSSDGHEDELGRLSLTLEDLSNRISSLVEGLASEKARLNEIRYSALQFEYSALQSKINPHFLYNTLEMINAMAKVKGEREISEMILLLADLMRESIRSKRKLIPLKEEAAYIRNYLKIQHILHERDLETRVDIPENLESTLVPNFILQPIVENAIVHGIEPRSGRGSLSIVASEEGGTLFLRVADDGVGMNEDKVKAILSQEVEEDELHTKMGLASVHRRIRILYGENFGVKIASDEKHGTMVTLSLPARGEVLE